MGRSVIIIGGGLRFRVIIYEKLLHVHLALVVDLVLQVVVFGHGARIHRVIARMWLVLELLFEIIEFVVACVNRVCTHSLRIYCTGYT